MSRRRASPVKKAARATAICTTAPVTGKSEATSTSRNGVAAKNTRRTTKSRVARTCASDILTAVIASLAHAPPRARDAAGRQLLRERPGAARPALERDVRQRRARAGGSERRAE